MDLESKRREYEILENDLKSTQSSYKTTKFAFIEKLSKECCFNLLLKNISISCENLDLNKSTLKSLTAQNKSLKDEIQSQCSEYLMHLDTNKHNLSVLEREREENHRYIKELRKLKDDEFEYNEREKEHEIVIRNLILMEDRINEIEKVGLVSEDELDQLVNEISEKNMRVRNYRSEVDENTGNIGRQERYLLYKKGMEFVAGITGVSVLDCVMVSNGFKVLVEGSGVKLWIVVVNNRLSEVIIIENINSNSNLKEIIEYSVKNNSTIYLIKALVGINHEIVIS